MAGCGDTLSLADLQTAKKHQLFEAEVITGLQGGIAGGASIDYATNQVTGQTQKTLPAVLRDAGFRPATFNFDTGGTLGVNDSDLAVLWPGPSGDGQYYVWHGALPKTVPASSSPASTGGVSDTAWVPLGDASLRGDITAQGYTGQNTRQQIRNRESARASNTIRFVTWNTQGGVSVNQYYGDDIGNRQRVADLTDWLLRIGADFIGYQEMWAQPTIPDADFAMYPYGSAFHGTGMWNAGGTGRRFGEVVAATRTLNNSTAISYAAPPDAVDVEPRTFIRTEMNVNGFLVVIYNCHMSTSPDRRTIDFDDLAARVSAESSTRVVMVGDWNTNIDSDYAPLINSGLTMLNKNGEIDTHNDPLNPYPWYLDRIFYKGFSGMLGYNAWATPVSLGDHKAFYADLVL